MSVSTPDYFHGELYAANWAAEIPADGSTHALRDRIAQIDGLAVTPDGMLTWESAQRIADALTGSA